MKNIVIVGNARCYHTMDWYRTIKNLSAGRNVIFATDLINSESHKVIVKPDDHIYNLYNIDHLLFNKQTWLGGVWRNFVKLLFFPIQVRSLRSLARKYPNSVFHAHTMYYMFVCWRAGIKFIGTPQGSEVLVRPERSRIYKYFAIQSLRAANVVTVDSITMRDRIRYISDVNALIVQNGIEADKLMSLCQGASPAKFDSFAEGHD